MFNSLVVPLDNSTCAEQALPLALSIARRANGRLDLVEVHSLYLFHERAGGWAPFFDPEQDAKHKQQEQLYLDATATWLTSMSRASVSTGVLNGSAGISESVVANILERTFADKADMNVMASHGHSSQSRIGTHSVADELIRRAGVPVLLVRPRKPAPPIIPEPVLDNILIPLDGSALSEQVLEPAVDLARLMEARCTLLRVVDLRSARNNGAPSESVYLDRLVARVREEGVAAEARIVFAHHVAEAILKEAEAQSSDLIALATQGRGSLARMLQGSVADQVVRAARSDVLIYRPQARDEE
jgi:nucleotide-binding universal stress UspA family protein